MSFTKQEAKSPTRNEGSVTKASKKDKDPMLVKEKLFQRMIMKMGKQFGDDPNTLQIISSVVKNRMRKAETLRPDDIDKMENDIFQRLSNQARAIAIDAFHPRLVANANIKRNGLDKHGMPIPNDNSFMSVMAPQNHQSPTGRAQTTNQGYRKHSHFFKLSKTTQPAFDLKDSRSKVNGEDHYFDSTVEESRIGPKFHRHSVGGGPGSNLKSPLRKSGSFNAKTSPRVASFERQEDQEEFFKSESRKTCKKTSKAYDMIRSAMGAIQHGSNIFSLTNTAHHAGGENMPVIITKGNQRKSQQANG